MTQPSASLVNHLLTVSSNALKTRTMKEFLLALRTGYEELSRSLIYSSEPQVGLNALNEALSVSRRNPRQRRALELCAWPIFEKPWVPPMEPDQPELLWLFAIPVLVQFPQGPQEYVMMPGGALDNAGLIEALEASGNLNPKAIVSGFDTLYSREDLQAFGPQGISERFVQAETCSDESGFEVPLPLPVILDPEIESGRARLLFGLFAARLPSGVGKLFKPGSQWPLDDFSAVVSKSLTEAGIEFESVKAGEPCSVAEMLLRCSPASVSEMERWIELGIEHYELKSLYLTLPVDGMAELVGVTEDGQELLLAPTFSYVEPSEALSNCVQEICRERRLPFKGMFSSAVPTSSALH